MSQETYFREELAFLKEQGAAFTEVHPQLSRFLKSRTTDPDVERLLEGFAFLTSRLRQKVEDDFPELTHSIINMLWPNYLRPVPSLSIVQFYPTTNVLSSRQRIEANCAVDSVKVMDTTCHFRTCRGFNIYPIEQVGVQTSHSRESSIIDVQLQVLGEQDLASIDLRDLQFYLGGDTHSAQMLYLWLNHYLARIDLISGDKAVAIPAKHFQISGFESGDAIMPYPKNVHEGYRILQEYLTFPQAFLFCGIDDLSRHISPEMGRDFTLRFVFEKTIPSDVRVRPESFSLFCTPVVNLFSHGVEPIDLTGKRSEYRIVPSSSKPKNYEVFSIDKVQGWKEAHAGRIRGEKRVYTAFESFQHDMARQQGQQALYYRTRVKDSARGDGFDHFISFIRDDEDTSIGLSEAVSIQATCTNRQLPVELGVGDICKATDSSPTFAEFSNITVPTQPLRPSLDGSLLWTLISNLSLNYLSLLSKSALCFVLRAYDFRALVDKQAERIARTALMAL